MNRYEYYKKLSCPGGVAEDWSQFVSYESTWDRHLCEPSLAPIGVYMDRLEKAEARVSWLEFQIKAARNTLSSKFGR